MPWEQEAGTPNPNCTFQRRQCERWEESRQPGKQDWEDQCSRKCKRHLHRRARKGQGAAVWVGREKRGPSQVKQALERQGFTILSIRFSRTLKQQQQQNQVWFHVRKSISESITILKPFPRPTVWSGLKRTAEALRGQAWWWILVIIAKQGKSTSLTGHKRHCKTPELSNSSTNYTILPPNK